MIAPALEGAKFGHMDRPTEIRHLLRTVKNSLELAIMARAPSDLVNRLARVAGLLDAVSQLPTAEGPAGEITPALLADALSAIEIWQIWEKARAPSA
jgi:hypothetical protein